MDPLKIQLESGAELTASIASFPEGNRLYKTVAREMQTADLQNGTVQQLSLRFMTSEEIEQALWPCMARATWKGIKVLPDLFENPEARSDFLKIKEEVMIYNLLPFSKGLGSLLKELLAKSIAIQIQK